MPAMAMSARLSASRRPRPSERTIESGIDAKPIVRSAVPSRAIRIQCRLARSELCALAKVSEVTGVAFAEGPDFALAAAAAFAFAAFAAAAFAAAAFAAAEAAAAKAAKAK